MSRIFLFVFCAICMVDSCASQGSRNKRGVMAGSFSSAGVGTPGLMSGMSMGNGMGMGMGMSMGNGMGMLSGMTSGMAPMAGFGNFGNLMAPLSNYPNYQFLGYNGPYEDFNALYQQFLGSLFAAQNHAAQNSNYFPMFQQQIATLIAQQQAAMARIPFAFPNFNGQGSYQGSYQGQGHGQTHRQGQGQGQSQGQFQGQGLSFPPFSGVFTGAAVNYGPKGGFGQAASFPGGHDGLGVRIAEELPAPSGGGGTFGVFTSSSSGMSDFNGKKTAFKTSTFGTNDNGKITFKTINE